MGAKKYYAVARGRKPGIYDNWAEAQKQVMGYAGAVYKGFPDRKQATEWMKMPHYGPAKSKAGSRKPPPTANPSPMAHGITIYTDGGSIYNPGPGGYGAIIIQDDRHQEITGGFRLTTNNRMELMACIAALRALKSRDRPITIFSDSSYVVNGISKGWAANWRRRGWIKADGKPAVNPDLWQELLNLVTGLDITFQWVRGHAGNPLNERCDELAVTTARQDNLPVDTEYERV